MKQLITMAILLSATICVSGQVEHGFKGAYDIDSFPTVTFVWNSAELTPLKKKNFELKEDDRNVEFTVDALPLNGKKMEKRVLFLWEDMASHSLQSEFTRTVLTRFFEETDLYRQDRFNVAVFNRRRDSQGVTIRPLMQEFTKNKWQLVEAVKSYGLDQTTFGQYPLQSDIYTAISEGIELMMRDGGKRADVIVVFTAGLNVKASGASTEMETVRQKAEKAHIPIFVMKYPVQGDTPEINLLSQQTHGVVAVTTDAGTATAKLKGLYGDFDSHLRGRDYRIRFLSAQSNDGKPHAMRLTVNRERQRIPPLVTPEPTLWDWVKQHVWLVVGAGAALLAIIALIVTLITKNKKDNERTTQELQERMRREREESERRNKAEIEKMKQQQRDQDERRRREEAIRRQRDEAEEEQQRLWDMMQAKNLFPRLQCVAGQEQFSYAITKPFVTIGRDAKNDVSFDRYHWAGFNKMTVSGHHADILFDGSSFKIVNCSHTYRNGVLVNGQFYQEYVLRSGDTIALGEAVITFYL